MERSQPYPSWDASQADESVQRFYEWSTRTCQELIIWYDDTRRPYKKWSKILRAVSMVIGSIGALCPIMDGANLFGAIKLGNFGYVMLAIAGSIYFCDRHFGISKGWMRFISTQIGLENELRQFVLDWAIAGAENKDTLEKLKMLRSFVIAINRMLQEETDVWVTEFRANLSELEKFIKSRSAATRRKAGGEN